MSDIHPSTAASSDIEVETCSVCRFYVPDPKKDGKEGHCRARSPLPLVNAMVPAMDTISGQQYMRGVVNGFFPPTNHTLWCGDFQRKRVNGLAGVASFRLPDVRTVGETEVILPPADTEAKGDE